MKLTAALAITGALLGAIVAVIAHFASLTVPEVYYIGETQLGNEIHAQIASPLVHPSWWPTLPLANAVGLIAGAVVGGLLHRLGIRVSRTSKAEANVPD